MSVINEQRNEQIKQGGIGRLENQQIIPVTPLTPSAQAAGQSRAAAEGSPQAAGSTRRAHVTQGNPVSQINPSHEGAKILTCMMFQGQRK